jgi:signal transduction histidine kinase
MASVSQFFHQNIVTVYFLYGLAFFSMGLAVWLESGRTSQLRLARAMGPLAAFGILHGLHEWLEMFQVLGIAIPDAPRIAQSTGYNTFRIGLLALSFVMLIIFGVRLIHSNRAREEGEARLLLLTTGTLLGVWLVSIIATQRYFQLCFADCLVIIDVLSRYILGMPGALLAAWAMFLEQRTFQQRGMVIFGRDLRWAAAALVLYGVVGQIFVPAAPIFPADVINSDIFFQAVGIPIQFFRAIMAGTMALFIIRAMRAFELENQQHIKAVNEARLAAQEDALEAQERARIEMERLNRDLQMAIQDLSLLYELSRRLAASLDRDTILDEAFHTVLRSIPRLEAGLVLLREQDNGTLRQVISKGCEAERQGDCHGLVCEQLREVGYHVVATSAPAVCTSDGIVTIQTADFQRPGPLPALRVKGRIVGVPLLIEQQVIGSLILGVCPDTPPFTDRDISLLSTISSQMSIAIENASLYEEVQEREALRAELYRRIVSAQERERQRIARELHDGTGQVLTGLGLGLKAAAETVLDNPELASRQLTELKDLNARAIQELRELIADLRPSVLDDLGLVPALHGQVNEFEERTGVRASMIVSGRRRRLAPEVETVLFRIAQEALTNVAKHADAEHVMVRLVFEKEALQLIITDDGRGFDPQEALHAHGAQRRAWGLLGMQERITLIDGACEIASQPGRGSTVRAIVPLAHEVTAYGEREDQVDVGG